MTQSLARPTYGTSRLLATALAGFALIGAGGAFAQSEDGTEDAHARSLPIREGGNSVSPNPQSVAASGEKVDAGNALNAGSMGENARAGDPIPDIDITCQPCGKTSASHTDDDTDGDGLADPSETARGKAGKALAETVKHNEQSAGMSGGPGDADGDGLGDAALDDSAAARSGRNPQTGKEIK